MAERMEAEQNPTAADGGGLALEVWNAIELLELKPGSAPPCCGHAARRIITFPLCMLDFATANIAARQNDLATRLIGHYAGD